MEVRLLGPLDVVADGQSLALGGLRQRAVLALLAINANDVLSAERIADEVWAGEPPRAAPTTLQGYVFHLRKALGDGPVAIETRKPGYVLRVDPELIDVRRCERLVAEASQEWAHGRPAVAAALLRDALSLWRGDPLADFAYEPFAETEISRLAELRLTALEARIEADLALGQHDQLVPELDALVREHPLRETLRGHLMLALHGSGRSAEALRVYSHGRELLAEELGIDPGLALQRLERAILMQDADIEAAPPAPVVPTGNLPATTTSFVGRGQELRDVAAYLGRNRLVTLTGPGGTGKTRLALECATRAGATYADGTWMIELAGLTDPELIPAAISGALGVTDEPDRTVLDGLVAHLRGRAALLVVDNCEHLIDGVAHVIDTLLRACPRLRVLATSREALGVEGELAWPVPTLAVPDPAEPATLDEIVDHAAIALFLERAGTAHPGFEANDANIATLVSICRHLDGMPLAIELAAARMRVLSVDQVADRLRDRFRLLTAGGRTGLSRHRTLRATVDWSYESLSDVERVLFDRLSVFAGTFTLERAEAVCGLDPLGADDVLDLLTGLVNKSLVTQVSGDTEGFRLLETLREYGAERLTEHGEAEILHRRHAAAFTTAAVEGTTRLRGPDGRGWLDRLEAEHEDSRAALEWLIDVGDADGAADLAVALWPFWWHRASIGEGRAWLRRVLGANPSPAPRLSVLVGVARLATMDSDLDTVTDACDEGLRLAETLGDGQARGELLVDQAERLRTRGEETDNAIAMVEEALVLLQRGGSTWAEANAMRLRTLLAQDKGDANEAETFAERCLSLFEACGDVAGSAGARFMLAGLARDRGDLGRASELYQRSLVQFREMREPWGVADANHMLGTVALAMGDVDGATRLAAESLRIDEELGHHRGVAGALLLLGQAAMARRDLERARALSAQSLEVVRDRQFLGYLVSALITNAQVALAQGFPERAEDLCDEALAHNREHGAGRHQETSLAVKGLARARQGDAAGALRCLEESLERAQAVNSAVGAARALEAMAEAALVGGEFERAARYLSAARSTRRDAGVTLTGPELADHQRVFAVVRDGIGGTTFGRAWARDWDDEIDLRKVTTVDPDGRARGRP